MTIASSMLSSELISMTVDIGKVLVTAFCGVALWIYITQVFFAKMRLFPGILLYTGMFLALACTGGLALGASSASHYHRGHAYPAPQEGAQEETHRVYIHGMRERHADANGIFNEFAIGEYQSPEATAVELVRVHYIVEGTDWFRFSRPCAPAPIEQGSIMNLKKIVLEGNPSHPSYISRYAEQERNCIN